MVGLIEPPTSSSSSSRQEKDTFLRALSSETRPPQPHLLRFFPQFIASSLNFFMKLKDGVTRKR